MAAAAGAAEAASVFSSDASFAGGALGDAAGAEKMREEASKARAVQRAAFDALPEHDKAVVRVVAAGGMVPPPVAANGEMRAGGAMGAVEAAAALPQESPELDQLREQMKAALKRNQELGLKMKKIGKEGLTREELAEYNEVLIHQIKHLGRIGERTCLFVTQTGQEARTPKDEKRIVRQNINWFSIDYNINPGRRIVPQDASRHLTMDFTNLESMLQLQGLFDEVVVDRGFEKLPWGQLSPLLRNQDSILYVSCEDYVRANDGEGHRFKLSRVERDQKIEEINGELNRQGFRNVKVVREPNYIYEEGGVKVMIPRAPLEVFGKKMPLPDREDDGAYMPYWRLSGYSRPGAAAGAAGAAAAAQGGARRGGYVEEGT